MTPTRAPTVALALAVLVFFACATPAEPAAPADVIYENGGTDEVWLTMADATPMVSDSLAPQLTAPTGPISRAGAPPTFTWTPGIVGSSMMPPDAGTTVGARDVARPTLLARVMRELFPVAHAHDPPVTGAMFRLVFDLGTSATPLRVVTGATTYTPDAAAWARVLAATAPVPLTITSAYLNTGRIEQGPYVRSMPATLTLR
jgi:hypothetical protein